MPESEGGTDPHAQIDRAIKAARDGGRAADELVLQLSIAEQPGVKPELAVDALVRASLLAYGMGQTAQGLSVGRRALDAADAAGYTAGRVNALSELGVQARHAGELERSANLLCEALALAGTLGDKRLLARAAANYAVTLRRQGMPDLAFDNCQAASRLYRDLGDLVGANRMLHLQSQIQQDQGLLHEARQSLEEVIALDDMTGDTAGRARSSVNLGLLLWQLGELEPARQRLLEGLAVIEKLGSPGDALRVRSNLGLVHRAAGDYDAAILCFSQSAARARELGLQVEAAHALSNLAGLLAVLERFDEAETAVAQAAFPGAEYRQRHSDLLTRARIALHRGKNADAVLHARQAAELAQQADNPAATSEALRVIAECLHADREHEQAREAVLEALEQLEQADGEPDVDRLLCTGLAASIEHARGRKDDARAMAEEAAEVGDRLGQRAGPEAARMLSHLRVLTREE